MVTFTALSTRSCPAPSGRRWGVADRCGPGAEAEDLATALKMPWMALIMPVKKTWMIPNRSGPQSRSPLPRRWWPRPPPRRPQGRAGLGSPNRGCRGGALLSGTISDVVGCGSAGVEAGREVAVPNSLRDHARTAKATEVSSGRSDWRPTRPAGSSRPHRSPGLPATADAGAGNGTLGSSTSGTSPTVGSALLSASPRPRTPQPSAPGSRCRAVRRGRRPPLAEPSPITGVGGGHGHRGSSGRCGRSLKVRRHRHRHRARSRPAAGRRRGPAARLGGRRAPGRPGAAGIGPTGLFDDAPGCWRYPPRRPSPPGHPETHSQGHG